MSWPSHYMGDIDIKKPWDAAKVAQVLDIDKKDVYRLARMGELIACRRGARKNTKLFFDPDEVILYDRGRRELVATTDA